MYEDIQPSEIWKFFIEISKIPRPSKHEEKILEYLINFARTRGLEYNSDSAGNLVIRKKAVTGKENSPVTVLQSHIDMVCEKNDDKDFDFLNDPLKLIISDEYVKADGTTLGADDGMGVAASLAVLDSSDISHGPLECLFTVDEETGLTGANALAQDFITGKFLLNLDSEEEGAIYIGCAGGKTTSISKRNIELNENEAEITYRISIDGLAGGHSGLVINKGHGNAVILLSRFLWNLNEKMNFTISAFSGGDKHNAIPREASADINFREEDLPIIDTETEKYTKIFRHELNNVDEKITIRKKKILKSKSAMSEKDQSSFLNLLYSFPHGVYAMSRSIKGLVETSTNLASAKFSEEGVNILTSQRSSVETSITDMADKIIAHALLAGYDYFSQDPYPAWTPDPESELLKTAVEVHESVLGSKPEIKAVHAGLECGIIGKKYPGIEMISFGPDVEGAHSPDERVSISSVANFWKFLTALLEKI